MASVNYQYELIKMYLAAFIRPPEKSGLEYWLQQLGTGKSFDAVLETVFSLDIVTDIYPADLPNQSFVTLIYVNVFGKSPDLEGLNYWTLQMINGRSRGNLVLDMINAGLNTQDGTEGKAYIINRLAVSQFAVDQQIYQKADISPAYLKEVMQSVNADAGTVMLANKLLGSNVTGIGLGAPINAVSVLAATDGLSAVEVNAGITVSVDLTGTNAVVNNVVELLLDNLSFSSPIAKQLSDAEIKAKKVSLVIPKTANWGNEGSKLLSAIVKDNAGNTSPPGGDLRVELNLLAPNAPGYNLTVPAASDSINLAEKISGVAVSVILLGTDAVAGDKVEILLNGQSFTQKILTTITSADVQAGIVNTLIPGSVNWGLDGDKLLAARIIDLAGNVGGIGGNVVVNLDTTAPLAPINAIQIPAAANGLNYLERSSPVQVRVDLNGTNAKVGDSVELLVDDKVFASSTKQELTAADVSARFVMVSIAPLDPSWNILEGNRTVSARLIDSAGNIGRNAGNLLVLVDSNAPRSETTSFTVAAASDGISAAEVTTGVSVLVNLIGSGVVAGDTIHILNGTDPTEVLFSQVITAAQVAAKQVLVTVPASANWGKDGSKVLAVSFTDIAGNIGSASPSVTVFLDTQAPLASTVDLQVPASSKGINTIEKASGVTVNVSLGGTQALVKDQLEILLAGTSFATPIVYTLSAADIESNQVAIVVPGNAAWGADGIKKLSARVIDVAGNVGASSTNFDVLIDTLAPTGPLTAMLVPANADGGISIAEKNVGVEVKLSLVGTNVQIGDSVELLVDGVGFSNPVTRILTDSDLISKSVSLTIGAKDGWGADGSKSLSARFTDFAGNVGLPSGIVKVTLDGVPPNPTNGVLTIAAAQNGINAIEKNSVIDVIVNLNGTGAVSGDTINLYLDGKPFPTPIKLVITAAQIIAKSATMKIPADAPWGADGAHVLSVLISDAAGNLGQAGGELVVILDTIAPGAGTLPLQMPAATDGVSAIERSLPMSILVSLAGTGAVALDKVEILNNGVSFKNPIIQTLNSDDVVSGTTTISVPGGTDWGADGTKNISFRLVDVAGNVGGISSPLVVSFDTQAPLGPTKPLIVPANLGGGISLPEKNAGVDAIVNLTGASLVAGDAVELLIGGNPFAVPVKHVITAAELAAKSLTMTIPASAAWGADGTKNLTARFIDIAGNIGNGAGSLAVTLDTTVLNSLVSPLIVAVAVNGINAEEKNAGVDVIVNLDGTGAVSGDQIQLFIDGLPFPKPIFHTITAAQVLAKTATISVPKDADWGLDGQHVISVSLIDKAGNVSNPSGDLSITLDTTTPATLITPIEISAAANGINSVEKSAGVLVLVDLKGTGVTGGERLELLLDGKVFSPNASVVLSSADIANGAVTLTLAPSTNWGLDGSKNVSARLIDVAGNVGLSGGNLVVTLDTSAPPGPTSPLVVPASAGGVNAAELNAGLTVVVNLTGTKALAGDTIEILVGGNSFAKPVTHIVTAAELAAKSVSLTVGVGDGWGTDGLKNLTARFIDVAGNLGAASGLLNITIDSVAPNSVSQALQVVAASNAISNAERSAGVNVVVDLTGTNAVAGDVISVLINGVPFATPVTTKITGPQITAKSATVLIPGAAIWGADGNKNLSAVITDAVGNVSVAGGNVDVTLDTTAPVAPTNPVLITAAINGISAAEKLAGVNVRIDLSGSGAMVGDRLELLIGGLAFAVPIVYSLTAIDLASGIVNLTIATGAGWGTDGTKLISTRLTDVAGNIGSGGVAASVLLDTTAPIGPGSSLVIIANSGGGITVAERNAGVDVLVNLSGTSVVAGDVVEILLGGVPFSNPIVRTLTAADVSAKNVTLTIGGTDGWGADGTKVLTARFIDIAGNVGIGTGTSSVILDGGAPNPPMTPLVLPAAVNGISSAEKAAGVAVVVNLTGTGAVAGDVIRIQLNTVDFLNPVAYTITAAQATARSATVVIPGTANWGADGSKILTANITDVLGNIGSAGGDVTVILDTIGPVSPVNPLTIASASNGVSMAEKSAGVSVSVDLTGMGLIAGEGIELLINDFPFATPLIRVLTALDISNGLASITIPSGASWGVDGTKVISVRGIDIAGNLGSAGGARSILLDTTAPAGPSNTLTVVANDNGGITAAEKNAGVAVAVNLAGTSLVAGDKVELLIGGLPFATPIVRTLTQVEIDANLASLTIAATDGWGADGSKTLTARFIDLAGNIGAGAGSLAVTMLDTTAPNLPSSPMFVAAAVNGINVSEKNAGVSVLVNLAGTNAVAGDVASLFLDGATFAVPVTYTITAGDVGAGNFSFTVGGTDGWGPDGNKNLSMSITDLAGNIGLAGGNVTVLLDATLPNAPATAVVVAAAANGINLTEKTLGVTVVVDLTGTNAVIGDRVEILMGGLPLTTPVFRILSSADIAATNTSIFIDSNAGWGVDGVKTISARIQDKAGNTGLPGGSLTTFLDTSVPSPAGLPVYTDANSSGTINAGDTFLFRISEATNKAISINDILVNNSHAFGVGATAAWTSDGKELTVTLGAGTTIAIGDIVTLVGVSDLAGNSLNLAFAI